MEDLIEEMEELLEPRRSASRFFCITRCCKIITCLENMEAIVQNEEESAETRKFAERAAKLRRRANADSLADYYENQSGIRRGRITNGSGYRLDRAVKKLCSACEGF